MARQLLPCVYHMAGRKEGALYSGVTSDLVRRAGEHKTATKGHTARYKIRTLVWYEVHNTMDSAIQREKNIKKWRREWKLQLIEEKNPRWQDLYGEIL